GVVYREFHNVSIPSSDLEDQGRRLDDKFVTLAGPVIGDGKAREIVDLVRELELLDIMGELVQRCQ
ncbi:MAG: MmgE/PrpD family protein, partial [Gemmatimonadales bacterium]